MRLSPPAARAALVLAAVAAAYANAFSGTFQYDDYRTILEDPHLAGPGTFFAHVGHIIRPLARATFLWDRMLWGDAPAGYHLLNVGAHAASALLVLALATRAFRVAGVPDAAGGLGSLWAALLFAVHPVGTEAVTYLSGRYTLLMACAYLAALLAYVHATTPGTRRAPCWLAASLGLLVAALLAKEVAVTFPLALLLWDGAVRGERGRALLARAARWHGPFWAVAGAFAAVAAAHPRYAALLDHSLALRPPLASLATQSVVVVRSLGLFVAPWQLNVDHDLEAYRSFLEWPVPAAVALLVAAAGLACALARRAPVVAFGLLWWLVHLLPTQSVVARNDLLSERNLYLPALGLYLAAASAVAAAARRRAARLGPRGRWAAAAAGTLAIVVLAAATVQRNALYADPVRLWADAARKSPGKARPLTNLGSARVLAGDLDGGIDLFRRALAFDPRDVTAQDNLRAAWEMRARRAAASPRPARARQDAPSGIRPGR